MSADGVDIGPIFTESDKEWRREAVELNGSFGVRLSLRLEQQLTAYSTNLGKQNTPV